MAESRVVTKTHDKVGKLLKQGFGDVFQEVEGAFMGREGSTVVMVRILPWESANDAQVVVAGGVGMDVDVDEECMRFLLEKNSEVVLGAFCLEGGRNIIFSHTILGSKIDKNELVASVRAVAATANTYDDVITSKWGGMKVDDMARRALLGLGAPDGGGTGPFEV